MRQSSRRRAAQTQEQRLDDVVEGREIEREREREALDVRSRREGGRRGIGLVRNSVCDSCRVDERLLHQ
jgi:predicted  nucleic acid-binding Zn-ribbon protein